MSGEGADVHADEATLESAARLIQFRVLGIIAGVHPVRYSRPCPRPRDVAARRGATTRVTGPIVDNRCFKTSNGSCLIHQLFTSSAVEAPYTSNQASRLQDVYLFGMGGMSFQMEVLPVARYRVEEIEGRLKFSFRCTCMWRLNARGHV